MGAPVECQGEPWRLQPFVTCPWRVEKSSRWPSSLVEAVGETIQFLVFIKARGVRARRVSVFPELMVLSELIDGAALNIKLTVLQGLLFREIFFFPSLLDKELLWIGASADSGKLP